jgi:predicted nucleotidyltransferase
MGTVMPTQTIKAATDKAITPQSIYLRKRVFANRDDINKLMDEYGVCNMRIFGSVACGMANGNSDIYLLADYKPECNLSLFDVARLEIELQPQKVAGQPTRLSHGAARPTQSTYRSLPLRRRQRCGLRLGLSTP